MIECPYRDGNVCRLASDLCGVEARTTVQACHACAENGPPEINFVTVSLAGNALREQAPEREQPFIEQHRHHLRRVEHQPTSGPGTELHRLLASWGVEPDEGCGCQDKAAEMDRRGPAWCRDNLETIVDWLMEEAKQRNWLSILARFIPGVARNSARKLVLKAIARAEAGRG